MKKPGESLLGAIGNTPIVELTACGVFPKVRIFGKLEGSN
ncbi:MAG: cysteine synthase B, partial [Deltaproteobacteria bacterium]|nr:cysteine synthase B [Deltaproteobacteria bacterium]